MIDSAAKKQTNSNIPDKILEQVSAFPSMPKAGVKLRALLSEEDVSVEKIEKILRQDPGLAANVLRLANSAFFGLPSKVTSLKHAVMLLGIKRFAKIAVGACMQKSMDGSVEGYGLSPGQLWLHSIGVSTIAEALAKNRKLPESSDFFTPALLHDLGKLVLSRFLRAEQSQIDSLVADGVPIVIAEKEVLKTDHAEIGALILTKWSFPDDIINAVRWHHYPEGSENSNHHPEIVYLANLMCQPDSSSESGGEHNLPYPSVLEKLSLEPEHYEAFAKKARDWMDKMSDTLTFD
jgi:putative nucleotidyltransferase with HDIG domain